MGFFDFLFGKKSPKQGVAPQFLQRRAAVDTEQGKVVDKRLQDILAGRGIGIPQNLLRAESAPFANPGERPACDAQGHQECRPSETGGVRPGIIPHPAGWNAKKNRPRGRFFSLPS